MRNIKLLIEYDGSKYYGWQKQPKTLTVQENIELAINKTTNENVTLFGSGRTDKGVHARGQVANFHTNSRIPANKFRDALNCVLPDDISIRLSEEVDESFHSRYSALGKEYRYLIYNNKIRSPIYRNYSYHVPFNLDMKLMKEAARTFAGTHDFKAFMSSGSAVKNTVRTIHNISLEKDRDMIELKVSGNGFLYNMVRIMTGTLIEIGNERIDCNNVCDIIESKDRTKAGHTAPAQGLYLEKVLY
ncbi:tRNA pseudouridine(38-40) synthase TruA [Brassicibacter mesophilus]|uniref:tRNA pseudouridine(38-40) synthase TruA n=1 Tax=Brassicibacter mesophilus TaxID=745119 RepID=UPI003D248018